MLEHLGVAGFAGTEAEIVVPNDKSTLKRPDRVVTKGAEAVVIDYKFGSNKEKLHYMQIKSYMSYQNTEDRTRTSEKLKVNRRRQ